MFRFTLRDWIWFCIVMALAIGWGSHVRYTLYTARLHQIDRPQKLDEAVSDYHKLIEEKYANGVTLIKLAEQIEELEMSTEQRHEMNKTLDAMKIHYPDHYDPFGPMLRGKKTSPDGNGTP